MSNFCRLFAARLALVAVMLHAFLPIASHAMMAKSGKSLAEICTAQGFKIVEIDDAGGAGDAPASINVGHECAVCAAASAPPSPISDFYSPPLLVKSQGVVRISAAIFVLAGVAYFSPHSTGPPPASLFTS
jgi:hypothetical protein